MNTAKRKPEESFAAYKLRRKEENKATKAKLSGRMIWVSCPPLGYERKPKGIGRTYIRAQYGEIGGRS